MDYEQEFRILRARVDAQMALLVAVVATHPDPAALHDAFSHLAAQQLEHLGDDQLAREALAHLEELVSHIEEDAEHAT